jgi:hypothetical protein
MLPVFMLFLVPFGGGIPAGVLLARANGLPWPMTAGLYFVSDVVLALAFELVLRLVVMLGRKVQFLARAGAVMSKVMARSSAYFSGTYAGPMTLVMISFGVNPITGRATALAAGHGIVAGWAFAIAGDMLYYAILALTTLRLNSYISDPNITILLVVAAMALVAMLVRYFRSKLTLGMQ